MVKAVTRHALLREGLCLALYFTVPLIVPVFVNRQAVIRWDTGAYILAISGKI